MAHLIKPIEWSRDENTGIARHRRRAAKLANRHLKIELFPHYLACRINAFTPFGAHMAAILFAAELKVIIRRSASMCLDAGRCAAAGESYRSRRRTKSH